MKKNLPWVMSTLLALALGVVCYFAINPPQHKPVLHGPSAEEISRSSSSIEGIKTNLEDSEYIVSVGFVFILDTEDAKKEFDKIKDVVVKPEILSLLADTQSEVMKTADGRTKFLDELKKRLMDVTDSGKITFIGITDFILVRI